jgi:hypothetical protein
MGVHVLKMGRRPIAVRLVRAKRAVTFNTAQFFAPERRKRFLDINGFPLARVSNLAFQHHAKWISWPSERTKIP